MHTIIRLSLRASLSAFICLAAATACATVTPLVAGPSSADSVWVTISVNDTLGNAANADTLELIWLHDGIAFDTVVRTSGEVLHGQYVIAHAASNSGALGTYQVLARARVSGRMPVTNYSYTVAVTDPCTGNGPTACTLSVLRTGGPDTTVVIGAALRIYNRSQTATIATASTDVNGRAIVYVPVDTFYVAGTHPAFTIAPRFVPVDFDGVSDTLWAAAFDPGAPAAPTLCRVYGWVYGLAGDTISGAEVHARVRTAPLRHQNVVISPYEVTTATDSVGYWFLDVIPSTAMTPDTTRYEFTIRHPSGAILRRAIAVPDTSEWLLGW